MLIGLLIKVAHQNADDYVKLTEIAKNGNTI